jgi:hypothetical protein
VVRDDCWRVGAHVKLDARQNGRLYGKDTPAKDILLVTKTKRPAPFNRFIKVMTCLLIFFTFGSVLQMLPLDDECSRPAVRWYLQHTMIFTNTCQGSRHSRKLHPGRYAARYRPNPLLLFTWNQISSISVKADNFLNFLFEGHLSFIRIWSPVYKPVRLYTRTCRWVQRYL